MEILSHRCVVAPKKRHTEALDNEEIADIRVFLAQQMKSNIAGILFILGTAFWIAGYFEKN